MRCSWAEGEELQTYHDEEWGVPLYDDSKLFELLTLEGAQAGLSWLTILKRRPGYVKAFKRFNPKLVAAFTTEDVERLMMNTEIIRNRGKIESTINNAGAVLELKRSGSSLNELLWSFVGEKPLQRNWKIDSHLPSSTHEAELMSKELKKRGFRFVGPTTCYSLMQAAGLVNDHISKCFRYGEVRALR
ncbi:MAG TPA: DNA-3-methyladenine glycosylase I [Acidimicrobiales bacterium]|nr:DNA-3-methyladenine glycosylase I [Acidimicrobiales bacterium]